MKLSIQKTIGIIIIVLGFLAIYLNTPQELSAQALRVLTGSQGGTGIGSTTAGSVGNCLKVSDDSPFTYTLGTCGSGGGSGTISTSTNPTIGDLAYWNGLNTIGSVATGTLTETATGLELSATRALVGGASILSLTSGFNIPLTASTTNWNTFYDTPSNRITAGTNLSWSGNTLAGTTFVSTSTAGTAGTLAYFTGGATIAPVSTTTLTATAPIALSNAISVIGNSASAITCATATGSVAGCLGTSDFNIFNNKLASTSIDTSAELDTILTDDTGSGALVFGTSPTLTSFFGTPCTGNDFLQDISDTGAFTCVTATGGGSGSLSTTTDNNAEVGETISYITSDFYIGGSASNTAEFNFDKDSAKFTISSTSASATGTISSPSGGLIFGKTSGETIEYNFNTSNTLKLLSSTGIDLADYGGIGLNSTASSSLSALRISALKDNAWSLGTNGMVLQTNGSVATWVATSTLGLGGAGAGDGVSNWSYNGLRLSPTTTVGIGVFASSTISDLSVTNGTTTNATSTSLFSTLGTFTNAIINTLLTTAGLVVTSFFDLVSGTGITIDAEGEMGLDTTDTQLLIADTTGTARVIRTKNEVYKFSIGSTSPFFVSGVQKLFPPIEDGYVVSDIFCTVEGGTSKAVTLYGESITCDTDGQADDGAITIATIGAASTTVGVTMGATTGTVNAVNVTITGSYTRE